MNNCLNISLSDYFSTFSQSKLFCDRENLQNDIFTSINVYSEAIVGYFNSSDFRDIDTEKAHFVSDIILGVTDQFTTIGHDLNNSEFDIDSIPVARRFEYNIENIFGYIEASQVIDRVFDIYILDLAAMAIDGIKEIIAEALGVKFFIQHVLTEVLKVTVDKIFEKTKELKPELSAAA